jgi:hypothetical protein
MKTRTLITIANDERAINKCQKINEKLKTYLSSIFEK